MTEPGDKPPVDDLGSFIEIPSFPSAEDKLFTTAEDWWNNACLNFISSGWAAYSAGYKEAADILVANVEQQPRAQDILVYPILFLYRQYLELALKDLIRQARRLKDVSEPFPKTHGIDELWRICHQLLSEISPGDSVAELEHIGRLISEFSQVDPTSMAFRYPEDKEGNPSLPGITQINLRNVRDVIGKIASLLYGADAQIAEYLSIKAGVASYYGK